METIVCATRGGEAGRRTQERAIALAKERGAELVFLSVSDPGFAGQLNSDLATAVAEEQMWLGRALMGVARARARVHGVEAGAVVRSGPVVQGIEDYLCESGASTLVIGEPKINSPLATLHVDQVVPCAQHVEHHTGVEVIVVTPED
jgi:nucleotide-binding universal stress UspA family protein